MIQINCKGVMHCRETGSYFNALRKISTLFILKGLYSLLFIIKIIYYYTQKNEKGISIFLVVFDVSYSVTIKMSDEGNRKS